MITCQLQDETMQFALQFKHLYHRICRLADNLAGYYLCGDAHIIIVSGAPRNGVPEFISVTFDEKAASAFEARTDRTLAKQRFAQELPKPKFPVRLETQFSDGGREEFTFDFAAYSDETIDAFCKAICDSARRRFRHRFSRLS